MEQTDNWYYSEFEAVKLIQHESSNNSYNTANPLYVQLPSPQSSVETPVEPPPSYSR